LSLLFFSFSRIESIFHPHLFPPLVSLSLTVFVCFLLRDSPFFFSRLFYLLYLTLWPVPSFTIIPPPSFPLALVHLRAFARIFAASFPFSLFPPPVIRVSHRFSPPLDRRLLLTFPPFTRPWTLFACTRFFPFAAPFAAPPDQRPPLPLPRPLLAKIA